MADSEFVHEFSETNFNAEVEESDLPVLVDFWAPWCAPCLRIAPHVAALAEEYQGKVKVGKLNVDEAQKISERFNIRNIPTLMVFKGGQAVDQLLGAVPKDEIKALLDKNV